MCFFGTQIKNTLTCVFLARIIILNEVIIVKNLKKLRDEHNLTQQQMADIFGLQRPTYTRYEKGERQPDFETLIKISDYFNVSVPLRKRRMIIGSSVEDFFSSLPRR